MTWVWIIATVLLCASGVITITRLILGPNTLDRLVALDTAVAVMMGGLGVWAAFSTDTTVVPAIVALALLGFLGSIAVARFRVRDDEMGGQ